MSFGFDFGRLRSDSTGLSFVGQIAHVGNVETAIFDSPAYEYATAAQSIILPSTNTPANVVPQYPIVTTTLNQQAGRLTVNISASNIVATILVFVR
jgi:hypothetical protein